MLEDRISPNDRPHRFSIGGVLQLPFGQGQKWGSDWNAVLGRAARRLAGQRHLSVPVGRPARVEQQHYYDAACGDPTDLKSNIGKEVSGGIAGLDVPGWDTVVLLLPRRGGADQRRGRPGQAARRPAHPDGEQRAVLPVDAAARAHRRPAPARHRAVEELRDAARHAAPDAARSHQRAELHRAVEPEPDARTTRTSGSSTRTATTRATSRSACGSRSNAHRHQQAGQRRRPAGSVS